MIRIIVRDCCMSPADGAVVAVSFRTFDVEAPQLQKALLEMHMYTSSSVIGAEVLLTAAPPQCPPPSDGSTSSTF